MYSVQVVGITRVPVYHPGKCILHVRTRTYYVLL
jgi:hypothetical protein